MDNRQQACVCRWTFVAKQVDFASETQRNRHGLHAGSMPSESRFINVSGVPPDHSFIYLDPHAHFRSLRMTKRF